MQYKFNITPNIHIIYIKKFLNKDINKFWDLIYEEIYYNLK